MIHIAFERMAALLFLTGALLGQNPFGRITGRVVDSSGAAVAGARVRAIHLATNVETAGVSNSEGNYELPNLNPGTYRLEVTMEGFKRYDRTPLEVRVGDVLQLEALLELGALAESVTVSAEAPLLESATASLGMVVDNRRILDLPLPGGNPVYLAQLTPGVVSTNPPTHGWLPVAPDAASNLATSGTRTRSSEFTLDGIPNMTRSGQISYLPPPEIVQEFRVQTTAFDASVGRFTGAHINMVLKSGTNDLHGSLWYSHVSRPLMTRGFFINRQIYDTSTGPPTKEKIDRLWPSVRTNRYRGSAGGPVEIPGLYQGKNRTFWVYGFDAVNRVLPAPGYFTVPTQRQRTGDFSELLALDSRYQIYDPATIAAAPGGRFSRQPLGGNLLPASRFNPVARKILEYYPLPNAAGTADGRNNYFDPQPNHVDLYSHTARVDHVVSQSQRLYGTLSWSDMLQNSGQTFRNDAIGLRRSRNHRGFALDDVLLLRPDLVVNLRYGFTRFILHDRPQSLGFDIASLGFPVALTSRLDRSITSFPQISVGAHTGVGSDSGFKPTTNYHSFSGNVSNVRGNHSLRLGGEFRALQENNYSYGNVSPNIEFGSLWTRGPLDNAAAAPIGQELAAFLMGLPTGGYIDRNASYAEQSKYLGLYLQDDWKLTRTLTVTAGLRYELEFPTTERFDRTNRGFDFGVVNPIQEAARSQYARSPIPELPVDRFTTRGGLLFSGVNGVPRGLWDTRWKTFSPRLGLAWLFRPRTAVRAGYGIFFESVGSDRTDVFQQGFSQRTAITPSLDNGLTFRATLSDPLPDGWLEPAGASGGLKTFLGRAVGFVLPERKAGYMQRWSFNVQQEFAHRVLLEVGYVGSRGTGLGVSKSFNPVPPEYLSRLPVRDDAVINFLSAAVANPFFGLPEFDGSGLQGRTVARSQLLRPYPHFTGVGSIEGTGYSWYHSLQVRTEKRFSHGYTIQASYTWSKFMEAVERLNESDLRLHHVISPQDRPHHIVVSGIYELPFGTGRPWMNFSGWRNVVLGGWSIQGIYQGQSGPPIGFGNIGFYGHLHDMVLPRGQRTTERWFNTGAAFERDPRRALASNIRTFPLRLTGLRADGYNNWDLSVIKSTKLTERLTLQLRAEAQDALNHAMFSAPNTVPTSTLFGQVTSTVFGEQRRITVVGKLVW